MALEAKIRGVYGGPVSKKIDLPVTPELLHKLGACLAETFAKEAKKDFAKRGWSGKAHDGSPPVWESFSYRIVGESTIEVTSTYPGMDGLVQRGRKRGRMRWLTQERKDSKPAKYRLTRLERRKNMRRGGRVSKGERMPLVVPMKGPGGKVVFRTAPLTTDKAWIHPGIARFTFAERAARKGKAACVEVIKREMAQMVIREMFR